MHKNEVCDCMDMPQILQVRKKSQISIAFKLDTKLEHLKTVIYVTNRLPYCLKLCA